MPPMCPESICWPKTPEKNMCLPPFLGGSCAKIVDKSKTSNSKESQMETETVSKINRTIKTLHPGDLGTLSTTLHQTTSSICGWGDRPGDHCNYCNHSKKKHNSNYRGFPSGSPRVISIQQCNLNTMWISPCEHGGIMLLFHWKPYGHGSKPWYPSEHQNRW